MEQSRFFIGGEWVRPSSTEMVTVTSASTGEWAGAYPRAATADADRAVAAAREAFVREDGWRTWSANQRAEVLDRFAYELRARGKDVARTVSTQNGMPISVALQVEAQFPAMMLEYYADLIRRTPDEVEHPSAMGGTTKVRSEPIGVVAAIVPWNFPQALGAQKYAAALAAGCSVVLKPSVETALDSQFVGEAAQAAGLPAGVLNIVPGDRSIGMHLVEHPDVDKVAFTGSTRAGREIGAACGRLIRPATLELGGKSAAIFLEDAELEVAKVGEALFGATLLNNGQTCFLSTRILAPRSRYQEVVETFAALAESLSVGDALDPATQIGPLATQAHRSRVEEYIALGRSEGARLVTGGGRPAEAGDGWFLQPTVFDGVDNSWRIAQEEIFGPVLTITPYDDESDAIRIANESPYGLAGTVWTADRDRGNAVARQLHTGSVGINGYLPDLSSPFGGVKASGVGRELGPDGLRAYQVSKSMYQF
ncbi:aldehyde dehydrogenase [Nocardioides sp. YIM B13467]|uniref:aldehyde dehydrogenase n=1 Tax=Nocardioides sp. YIM B13467 TaxID=3366294 RepID=UPI00366AF705